MKTKYLIIISLLMALCGCQQASVNKKWRTASGQVWTTSYNIKYKASANLGDSIQEIVNQIEMSLSPFIPNSTISRINRGEEVEVDSLIATVFTTSQQINRLSHGYFDPTVAPLINLWGFGTEEWSNNPPDSLLVEQTLKKVGIYKCSLQEGHIIKPDPSTQFNFSAITKGYGCDLVAQMLRRNGCTDYMVEIGGEIALSGSNSNGEKWHIQIDSPQYGMAHKKFAVIEITDCGIATSGNYRNYRNIDDKKFGHTISPKDGYPVQTTTLSTTIIAPNTMVADALSTATMAMPSSLAMDMLNKLPEVSGMLIIAEGDTLTTLKTPNFPL